MHIIYFNLHSDHHYSHGQTYRLEQYSLEHIRRISFVKKSKLYDDANGVQDSLLWNSNELSWNHLTLYKARAARKSRNHTLATFSQKFHSLYILPSGRLTDTKHSRQIFLHVKLLHRLDVSVAR